MAAAEEAPQDFETGAVVALTHEGEGIIREGKAVFVPGALPGEVIRFRRSARHRQYDDGVLLEVLEKSADRVTPACAHFGICGGCALQHLAPAAQLAAKEHELHDNLERIAQVTPRHWLAPLAGPEWGYRRRARLSAKFVAKKGRVLVGFRERFKPYVSAIETCEVLAPPAAALIAPLAATLTNLSIRDRVPQIEVAVADNAVALVLRVMAEPDNADLEALRLFEADHRVRFYLQRGGPDSVRRLTEVPLEQPLRYALPAFALELEFAPTDFIQVNAAVNEALVARALELLDPDAHSRVLDLYCGIGNFTLALARRARAAIGVEADERLVARARHNAERHALGNAEFHQLDLAQPAAAAARCVREACSHVLMDPPRAGARAILPTVARLAPQRLLYISCHPGSLARDVGMLVHHYGFNLQAAGVLDMFPHTMHVESLALLERPAAQSRAA
jgi:23S rRNA (uracil1939-C5)-methyltransferase